MLPTDNRPTPDELFRLAIEYLDERIAWLQAERTELVRNEIARVRAELDARLQRAARP